VIQYISDMDRLSQLAAVLQARPGLPALVAGLITHANDYILEGQHSNAIRILYFIDLTFKSKAVLGEALERIVFLVSYNTAAAYLGKQDLEMALRFLEKAIEQLRGQVLRSKNKREVSPQALTHRRIYGQALITQSSLQCKLG
jgi:hypothetical protein